jgi:hypothetical protein
MRSLHAALRTSLSIQISFGFLPEKTWRINADCEDPYPIYVSPEQTVILFLPSTDLLGCVVLFTFCAVIRANCAYNLFIRKSPFTPLFQRGEVLRLQWDHQQMLPALPLSVIQILCKTDNR